MGTSPRDGEAALSHPSLTDVKVSLSVDERGAPRGTRAVPCAVHVRRRDVSIREGGQHEVLAPGDLPGRRVRGLPEGASRRSSTRRVGTRARRRREQRAAGRTDDVQPVQNGERFSRDESGFVDRAQREYMASAARSSAWSTGSADLAAPARVRGRSHGSAAGGGAGQDARVSAWRPLLATATASRWSRRRPASNAYSKRSASSAGGSG